MNLQPKHLQCSALPIELLELYVVILMEISGLDPEITICNIIVLPIKPYPLYADKGFEPLYSGHESLMFPLHQSACGELLE